MVCRGMRAAALRGASRAKLGILDDVTHRLRRGALHLPAGRSRQNANLFLREPFAPNQDYQNACHSFPVDEPIAKKHLIPDPIPIGKGRTLRLWDTAVPKTNTSRFNGRRIHR
jgi:hypothetical protein